MTTIFARKSLRGIEGFKTIPKGWREFKSPRTKV